MADSYVDETSTELDAFRARDFEIVPNDVDRWLNSLPRPLSRLGRYLNDPPVASSLRNHASRCSK